MRMISGATGQKIPCCWTDCDRLGDTQFEAIALEPKRNVHYLFCSERHKMLWVNSHKDLGQLPTGSRGLLAPR